MYAVRGGTPFLIFFVKKVFSRVNFILKILNVVQKTN